MSLSIQDAMNTIAGTTGLSFQDAFNSLLSQTGLTIQEASNLLYSVADPANPALPAGWNISVQDMVNINSDLDRTTSIQDNINLSI